MTLLNKRTQDFWIGFDDEEQKLYIADFMTNSSIALGDAEIKIIQQCLEFYKENPND